MTRLLQWAAVKSSKPNRYNNINCYPVDSLVWQDPSNVSDGSVHFNENCGRYCLLFPVNFPECREGGRKDFKLILYKSCSGDLAAIKVCLQSLKAG